MKKGIKDLDASIKGQLQYKAKQAGRPFAELLQFYGMERFLYRVSRSKFRDRLILKGALMFSVWHVPERRTTLDIDFLAECENRLAGVQSMIKNICGTSVVPDGLIFDPASVRGQRIKENADYEGV